jgi:hypothetical protein
MSKIEKIKRVVLISLGFAMATYLMMSGFAMLDADAKLDTDTNSTSEVHRNTVK